MTAVTWWWVTLGLGAVVIVVIAVLLRLIIASASRIRDTLVQVWVVGPHIASNTAHLDLLRRLNKVAEETLAAAERVAAGSEKIHQHANGCPGCPQCVVGWSGAGATR